MNGALLDPWLSAHRPVFFLIVGALLLLELRRVYRKG